MIRKTSSFVAVHKTDSDTGTYQRSVPDKHWRDFFGSLTMMTPVSLLASMMETRQVLARTAATTSSTSTRPVSPDTGTKVTSGTDRGSEQGKMRRWRKDNTNRDPIRLKVGPRQRRWPPTCLPFLLEVLGDQLDRVVLYVGGDNVRKADVAALRGSAAPPEVLHSCVDDQVVGLREDRKGVSTGCLHLQSDLQLYHLRSAGRKDDIFCSASHHPGNVLPGLVDHCFGFGTWRLTTVRLWWFGSKETTLKKEFPCLQCNYCWGFPRRPARPP